VRQGVAGSGVQAHRWAATSDLEGNMKKVFCIFMLAWLFLASCTAGQIPTSTPVPSSIPMRTLASTSTPAKTPEANQTEVSYAIEPLRLKDQSELVDTRINNIVDGLARTPLSDWAEWAIGLKYDGFMRTRLSFNPLEGTDIDFSYAAVEKELPDEYVDLLRQMRDMGIKTRYSLSFWDMEYRQGGGVISKNRLSTDGEIERYLAYVRMVVTSLKGVVDGYELWNEPNANYDDYQVITPEDYIRVARLAIPLIKEIDPQAKIVFASSGYLTEKSRAYSMKLLQSDVIALADAISLHAVNNDASPVHLSEYYYGYEAMWNEIKSIAEANGFHGEYIADELNYRSENSLGLQPDEPGANHHPYEPEIAAKYLGRMIAINLGLDISVGTSGTNAYERPIEGNMIRNLAYLLDGLQASTFPLSVQSESNLVRYYTFVDKEGNRFIAIWDDGEAKVTSDIFASSIAVDDVSAVSVVAMDPFDSTMQNLEFTNTEGGVNLDRVFLTDYPVIYKIETR
jgi:hypothetical protein